MQIMQGNVDRGRLCHDISIINMSIDRVGIANVCIEQWREHLTVHEADGLREETFPTSGCSDAL